MWPGPADPDFGVFVAQVARGLDARGHRIDRAVVDHRGGGPAKQAALAQQAVGLALRHRPDVVYAHYLLPAGALAALASLAGRAPLVVTAHGGDVANAARSGAIRAATALTVRRSSAVVAVSGWLRDELTRVVPAAASRTSVIDCGVDLARFAPRDREAARAALGLGHLDGPVVLFVGGLHERKNVLRLRDAVREIPRATLVVVGDGPLRDALAGPRVHLAGAVAHDAVPPWIAAADVLALPSLVEPLGQVVLEALAMGRPVVATRVGGPAELIPPQAGALVDPHHTRSIREGLERALALPDPAAAAGAAAAGHDLDTQVGRIEALLQGVRRT
jgi:glycosyltransferase involved in cell wall biosynthesis